MTDCKFYGFKSVVFVTKQCKVVMRDCLVDLTIRGPYGGEGNPMARPVVSDAEWEQRRSGQYAVGDHVPHMSLLPLLLTPSHITDPWEG
jgi:hypothetical protein